MEFHFGNGISLSLMLQVPRLLSPRLHREHDHWYLPRDYQGKSRAGEIQDQTSQHYRWIESLDMKQVATGCNKICCDTAGYKISRYVKVFNQFTQDYCCSRVHEATGRGLCHMVTILGGLEQCRQLVRSLEESTLDCPRTLGILAPEVAKYGAVTGEDPVRGSGA